jgi:hypothetical protein
MYFVNVFCFKRFEIFFFFYVKLLVKITKKTKKAQWLWVFSLWIGAVFIGEELVGSHDKLWAVCFLLFFCGVHSVLWVVILFVVNGYLRGCHSPDLFSVERLVVRYKPYLWCTQLRGCSWESASLVQLNEIFVDFAREDNGFFAVSLHFRHV